MAPAQRLKMLVFMVSLSVALLLMVFPVPVLPVWTASVLLAVCVILSFFLAPDTSSFSSWKSEKLSDGLKHQIKRHRTLVYTSLPLVLAPLLYITLIHRFIPSSNVSDAMGIVAIVVFFVSCLRMGLATRSIERQIKAELSDSGAAVSTSPAG